MAPTSTSTSSASAPPLAGANVLLCVSGGIAAYKACEVARLLVKASARVHVLMTEAATNLVGPLTFRALTGNPVGTDLFDPASEVAMQHTELGMDADLAIVAPATASVIGRIASGICDDLLTTTLMVTRCPVLIAPAMNRGMWANEAVQRNVEWLRTVQRFTVLDPDEGALACGVDGKGRLPDPERVVEAAARLRTPQSLEGRRVLITGGPTREYLDPVRFLSNPATGTLAVHMAAAARDRGAKVELILGPGSAAPPSGVDVTPVVSAAQLASAVSAHVGQADVLIMSAAVADWRPANPAADKEKKGDRKERSVSLEATRDVLANLAQTAGRRPFVLGFAAETADDEATRAAHARAKMRRKRCDLLFVNPVRGESHGFGEGKTSGTLLGPGGRERPVEGVSKTDLAAWLVDAVAASLPDEGDER